MLAPWKKSYDQPRQHIQKQRHYFVKRGLPSQSYGFSSSQVYMWELDYNERWVLKNWCWRIVGEYSWESLEFQGDPTSPSYRKSVLNIHWKDWCWSWNSNTWATSCKELTHLKDLDAGKDWRWDEKRMTEDEMVGWHHCLKGHEFEQALGVGDGQGGLACCSPWGH